MWIWKKISRHPIEWREFRSNFYNILSIRLRRAAELLSEGRLTVSEIGYMTGFSSVSYFSRCFRAMYGVPPTQFNAR